jgi:integrase
VGSLSERAQPNVVVVDTLRHLLVTIASNSLSRHQARALLGELPSHLREMATFTLATGLRAANVTGLTWDQVDLSRKLAWIHPDQAKARRAIAVPLNETAMQVLRTQRGKHPMRVFTYEGQPIKQVSTAA